MRKFILKILLFLFLFPCSAFLFILLDVYVIKDQYLGNYQASLIDKVERLKSIDEPQIVIIGDSSVCFGFNSEMIEDAFGMPVVDMGLHGGLGNAFHEDMAKLNLTEGDIIIICHTSYSDDDTIIDVNLAWITLETHKELWEIVRKKDLPDLIIGYPYYLSNAIVLRCMNEPQNIASNNTCYSRSAFNEYGDIVRRFEDSYEFTAGSSRVPAISDTCINRLNVLNEYIEDHGVTMLVAGYPIAYGEYTPVPSEFEEFEEELRDSLDCDVISHFTDYFIPYDYFYDTQLHLDEDGAIIRTEQLISDLNNWMN